MNGLAVDPDGLPGLVFQAGPGFLVFNISHGHEHRCKGNKAFLHLLQMSVMGENMTYGDKLQKLFREMERINETTAGFMATNVLKKERILHQEPSKCQD